MRSWRRVLPALNSPLHDSRPQAENKGLCNPDSNSNTFHPKHRKNPTPNLPNISPKLRNNPLGLLAHRLDSIRSGNIHSNNKTIQNKINPSLLRLQIFNKPNKKTLTTDTIKKVVQPNGQVKNIVFL